MPIGMFTGSMEERPKNQSVCHFDWSQWGFARSEATTQILIDGRRNLAPPNTPILAAAPLCDFWNALEVKPQRSQRCAKGRQELLDQILCGSLRTLAFFAVSFCHSVRFTNCNGVGYNLADSHNSLRRSYTVDFLVNL